MFSAVSKFALLTGMAVAIAAPVVHAEEKNFDIDRLPLQKALVRFARTANVSLVLPPLSYRDGKSQRVSGLMEQEAALAQLLADSAYTFETLPSGAIRIYRRPPAPPKVAVPEKPVLERPAIEEIMVTTTRRRDSVQKLPYSIAAFGGSALEEAGISTTRGVARHVASVSATNFGRGRNKLVIRGLSDGAFTGSTQSLVSTYLDYTRLTYNAPEPSLELVDIEQVEVLRGPHGTLYGSGALGGLYRIVTRKPDFENTEFAVTGSLAATSHGGMSEGISGVLNLPLLPGKLAARVVAYRDGESGYIDDVRLGLKNVNDTETVGGRFAVSAQLSPVWQVTVGSTYQQHTADDTSYYNGDLNRFERDNYLREPFEDDFIQAYARIDAHFSWADFVSSTSWMTRDIDSMQDATLAIPVLAEALEDIEPSPFSEDRWIRTITNETHLSSASGGRFEWLIGGFWSHRKTKVDSSITAPGSGGQSDFGPTDILYAENLADTMTEIAGFGELTYFLTEKFAATAGARVFGYDIAASSVLDDVGAGPLSYGEGDQHRAGFTPKFVLSYYADENSLFYLQGSEGYRVGGINLKGPTALLEAGEGDEEEVDEEDEEAREHSLTNFNPDKMFNLELGAKLTRMDGRLIANAALYRTWWSQIQSDQFSDNGLPVTGNVGNARTFGAELDLTYRPTAAWQWRANVAWNHAELSSVNPDFGGSLGAETSQRLPGAPAFSASIIGSYQWALTDTWLATLVADYSFAGKATLLFNSENSRPADEYHLANLRLDLGHGAWSVRLFVDNILNSRANSFAFGNPFSLNAVDQVTPLRPRTAGVEVSYQF